MARRFFDQWQVGDQRRRDIHRTLTVTDNLQVAAMTHTPQPLHFDAEAARGSDLGRVPVNDTFTRMRA